MVAPVVPEPVIPQPVTPANDAPTDTVEAEVATETEYVATEEKPFNCPSPWGGPVWEPNRSQTVYLESAALEGETCESTTVVCAY